MTGPRSEPIDQEKQDNGEYDEQEKDIEGRGKNDGAYQLKDGQGDKDLTDNLFSPEKPIAALLFKLPKLILYPVFIPLEAHGNSPG